MTVQVVQELCSNREGGPQKVELGQPSLWYVLSCSELPLTVQTSLKFKHAPSSEKPSPTLQAHTGWP